MDLTEGVAIGTIVSGVAAAIGIILSTISLVKSGLDTSHQNRVSSATLILDLVKPWREEKFKAFLEKVGNHSLTNGDEKQVEEFLNQLEIISIFWKDGTISENHIKEFFATNLKAARDDKFIQDFMKPWVDLRPDYYFVNLRELTKKVQEWKI